MSDKRIDISGLERGAVLAALYNASRPLGMGFLHYDPAPMTAGEGADILKSIQRFDYLQGRVMKVDLSGDSFDPRWYDRDNEPGAAQRAIDELRASGETATANISAAHRLGLEEAAEEAREAMGVQPHMTNEDGTFVLELGLGDVADVLGPAIDRAAGPEACDNEETAHGG